MEIIKKLKENKDLSDAEFLKIFNQSKEDDELLFSVADSVRQEVYGKDVYIRGLIEISNHCKNNCYYCGIRASNKNLLRYKLTKEDILECCDEGYILGFRTFVLQGGEDLTYKDHEICDIVSSIKENHPDCAVTLSLGEKEKETYLAYKNAGADRYLLRHETANEAHYKKLHPESMSLKNRKRCLFDLKELGYQVGSGFMVGSPYQTQENIIEDLRFLQDLSPDMIGIGPYLPHNDTPFKDFQKGSLDLTLRLISILRLMFPNALIPSTTALATISPSGREKGLKAGANVVMPNLSPKSVRKLYALYENKVATNEESAQSLKSLEEKVISAGYNVVCSRGDVKK